MNTLSIEKRRCCVRDALILTAGLVVSVAGFLSREVSWLLAAL